MTRWHGDTIVVAEFGKIQQKLTNGEKLAQSWQKLPEMDRKWQKLAKVCNSWQKL